MIPCRVLCVVCFVSCIKISIDAKMSCMKRGDENKKGQENLKARVLNVPRNISIVFSSI